MKKCLKSDTRTRQIPAIILTTTDDQREMTRCYDLGNKLCITKPVRYENLPKRFASSAFY